MPVEGIWQYRKLLVPVSTKRLSSDDTKTNKVPIVHSNRYVPTYIGYLLISPAGIIRTSIRTQYYPLSVAIDTHCP